jgi:hypothetical protein
MRKAAHDGTSFGAGREGDAAAPYELSMVSNASDTARAGKETSRLLQEEKSAPLGAPAVADFTGASPQAKLSTVHSESAMVAGSLAQSSGA